MIARRLAATALLAIAALACRAPSRSNDHDCAATEYRAFTPRLCGKGKRPGACVPRPAACAEPYAPVCGCDHEAYPSECDAHAAGVDLSVNGGCPQRIPGWLTCGAHFCDARVSYCEIVLSDVFELPTDWTCRPLPAGCTPGAPTCDCFPKGTRCLGFCVSADTGGLAAFRLTCRL